VPRILGVDVPKDKQICIALTYIYGIGRVRALEVLKESGTEFNKKAADLNEEEISKISSVIHDKYRVEGDLRRAMSQDIRRLMEIGCYRGQRHKRGLPVRGQRTKTNSRTRKGPGSRVGGK